MDQKPKQYMRQTAGAQYKDMEVQPCTLEVVYAGSTTLHEGTPVIVEETTTTRKRKSIWNVKGFKDTDKNNKKPNLEDNEKVVVLAGNLFPRRTDNQHVAVHTSGIVDIVTDPPDLIDNNRFIHKPAKSSFGFEKGTSDIQFGTHVDSTRVKLGAIILTDDELVALITTAQTKATTLNSDMNDLKTNAKSSISTGSDKSDSTTKVELFKDALETLKSYKSSATDYQGRIVNPTKKTNEGAKVTAIAAFVMTRKGEYEDLKRDLDKAYPASGGGGLGSGSLATDFKTDGILGYVKNFDDFKTIFGKENSGASKTRETFDLGTFGGEMTFFILDHKKDGNAYDSQLGDKADSDVYDRFIEYLQDPMTNATHVAFYAALLLEIGKEDSPIKHDDAAEWLEESSNVDMYLTIDGKNVGLAFKDYSFLLL